MSDAEAMYQQAITIREAAGNAKDLSESLREYAVLLRTTKRESEAVALEQRAAALK
jgi:hypothetical protein